jgi:hypothetical protein
MSVAEIKAEIQKLSPEEKAQLKEVLEADLTAGPSPADASSILGCMKGTAILKPGWDEDEPIEIWEALRDDASS